MSSSSTEGVEGLIAWFKAHEIILLSFIFLVGLAFRLIIYLRHPYSYGIDGPYYNLQVENILETGWLYKDDTPLVFYFLTLTSFLLGDVTIGIKVGTSILSALIAVPLFYLTRRVTKSWWAGYVAAFIGLFNPLHVRMLDDFFKNIAGILLMLTFLHQFLRTCEKPKLRNYAFSFSLLVMTFLTHIHPSGLSVLFIVGYVAILWLINRKPPNNELKVALVLIGLLTVSFVVAVALFPETVSKFSKVASFLTSLDELDLERMSPFGARQLFYLSSIPTVLGLTYYIRDTWKRKGDGQKSILLSIYMVCLLLSLPLIPQAFRWRFTLANFLPAALFGGYGIAQVKKDLPKIVFAGLLVVLLSSSALEAWEGSLRIGPKIDDVGVRALEELKDILPEDSAVIVRGHFHYWVQLITELPTFQGRENPFELHQQYGGPVYLIMDKGHPVPPNLEGREIYDQGPYLVFRLFPR